MFGRQLSVILRQGLRAELADPERIVSPLLFATTVLLLFSFVFSENDALTPERLFVAETFLTVFFALQITFARVFEPEREDQAFDVIRSYQVKAGAWFVAKSLHVLVVGFAILVPTMLLASLLTGATLAFATWGAVLGVSLLGLIGLTVLGVLVSGLTLGANARQIVFPLLYFPLTIPVLLAATETTTILLEVGQLDSAARSWLGLLAGFDVIYATLGYLLFGEVLKSQ
jgi:heme exporter protein B